MALSYTFRGNLVLHGSLHIGSGGSDDRTDATIVRDIQGMPYIPGSSLRGAFRAAVARLAPTMLGHHRLLPKNMQDHFDKAPAKEKQKLISDDVDESGAKEIQNIIEEKIRNKRDAARSTGKVFTANDAEDFIQDYLKENFSYTKRLFGTVLWASPLHIPDLPLLTNAPTNAQAPASIAGEIRHGVGIDRDTGAAREQVKYDFEVLPRGHAFRFVMRCDMDVEAECQQVWEQLLAIGLRLLEMGEIPLGGKIARGLGDVRLEQLEVFCLDTHDHNAMRSLLLSNEADARYGTRIDDGSAWVQRILEGL